LATPQKPIGERRRKANFRGAYEEEKIVSAVAKL
jgi:hypothetical protein